MGISGLILYLVPEGRIAYWTHWVFLGLSKTDWGNIHILSSILFLVAGIAHILFNWKALLNYFRSKLTQAINLWRELLIASVVTLLVILSSLLYLPPLAFLLDLNDAIKDAWILQDKYEPPFGHAELLSLQAFTKKMDINLSEAEKRLREEGIHFESTQDTLEEIAKQNGMTPMAVYIYIQPLEPQPIYDETSPYTPTQVEVEFSGKGIGRKTLQVFCEQLGINLRLAQKRLGAVGIHASPSDTIKAIATQYEYTPLELIKVILVPDYIPKHSN